MDFQSGRGRSRPSVKTEARAAPVTFRHLRTERHRRVKPEPAPRQNQQRHAVSTTLLHSDGPGTPRRPAAGRTGAAAQAAVPLHAGQHLHGSDHQPGQGESTSGSFL